MLLQHYQKKKKEKKNSLLFTLEIHIRRCKPIQNFQYHKNFKTKCGSKILHIREENSVTNHCYCLDAAN